MWKHHKQYGCSKQKAPRSFCGRGGGRTRWHQRSIWTRRGWMSTERNSQSPGTPSFHKGGQWFVTSGRNRKGKCGLKQWLQHSVSGGGVQSWAAQSAHAPRGGRVLTLLATPADILDTDAEAGPSCFHLEYTLRFFKCFMWFQWTLSISLSLECWGRPERMLELGSLALGPALSPFPPWYACPWWLPSSQSPSGETERCRPGHHAGTGQHDDRWPPTYQWLQAQPEGSGSCWPRRGPAPPAGRGRRAEGSDAYLSTNFMGAALWGHPINGTCRLRKDE